MSKSTLSEQPAQQAPRIRHHDIANKYMCWTDDHLHMIAGELAIKGHQQMARRALIDAINAFGT